MTSLEGGAGVGSGLGEGYKSPPPSARLNRGPLEARSARAQLSSRLLPGGGGGGGSERAPGLGRNGRRTPGCEDYRGKWLCLGWSRGEGRPGRRAGARGDRLGRLRRAPARSAGTGRAGRVALTMVTCWDTGVLLCALLGGLLLTGEARPRPEAGAGLAGAGAQPGGPGARGERARREPRTPVAVDTPGAVTPFLLRRAVGLGAPESSWLGSASIAALGSALGLPLAAGVADPRCLAASPKPGPPTQVLGSGSAAHPDLPDPQSLLSGGLAGSARPPDQRLLGRPRGCPGAGLRPSLGDVGHGPRRRASRGKEVRPLGGDRVPGGSTQIPEDGKSWYPSTHSGPPSSRVRGTFPQRPLLPPPRFPLAGHWA